MMELDNYHLTSTIVIINSSKNDQWIPRLACGNLMKNWVFTQLQSISPQTFINSKGGLQRGKRQPCSAEGWQTPFLLKGSKRASPVIEHADICASFLFISICILFLLCALGKIDQKYTYMFVYSYKPTHTHRYFHSFLYL